MNKNFQNTINRDYIIPQFEEIDFLNSKVQHWINFFGQEGLFTIKERIQLILEINQSVREEGHMYMRDIQELLLLGVEEVNLDESQLLPLPPKEIYEKIFTKYMLRTDLSEHHIIFKNKNLGGHPRYKDNIINMERGKHSSFHGLLGQENLYPHQQLSRFLALEKSTLPQSFLTTLEMLEKTYHKQFQKDPFSLYKPEVFNGNFKRNNFHN